MRLAVNFKVRTLLVLFGQIINKQLSMNTSVNLESLTKIPQNFERAKRRRKKKNIYLDKLAV